MNLTNAARGHRLAVKLIEEVCDRQLQGSVQGSKGVCDWVGGGLGVQVLQLCAEVGGEEVTPGGCPLAPFDECRPSPLHGLPALKPSMF